MQRLLWPMPVVEHKRAMSWTAMGLSFLVGLSLVGSFSFPSAEAVGGFPAAAAAAPASETDVVGLSTFFTLLSQDESQAARALSVISARWRPAYTVMIVELAEFAPNPSIQAKMIVLLENTTGERRGYDLSKWYVWIWQNLRETHPDYAEFKAALYEKIDPRFREYFYKNPRTEIRLDEIRWGGVLRDGIPPLKNPKMIPAAQATYLQDDNVVFGVEIHGDARAYPKRILAWHEMFKDVIGGEDLNGVYCTLCGSMILYRTTIHGAHYELGTSGFLYRSNKLMYDQATKSLWSTLTGKPVVGPLVGKGVVLEPLYVVTTTWGEWRRRHPSTTVLSPKTGYQRDYGEGVAYKDYFATDKLMFNVPRTDSRLRNKTEVLVLRLQSEAKDPLAISADFLLAHPVYHDKAGGMDFVVLTDPSGANRVYETRGRRFVSWDGKDHATDQKGQTWTVGEAELSLPQGSVLKRMPSHRAFWFGWFAVYPRTRLVR